MRDYEVVYIFKSALGTDEIDARPPVVAERRGDGRLRLEVTPHLRHWSEDRHRSVLIDDEDVAWAATSAIKVIGAGRRRGRARTAGRGSQRRAHKRPRAPGAQQGGQVARGALVTVGGDRGRDAGQGCIGGQRSGSIAG